MSIKKRILTVSLMLLIMSGCLVSSKLIDNHEAFLQLNAAMIEANIEPYDPNNLFIKDATLENMENEVVQSVKEFDIWYNQNISLEDEKKIAKVDVITNESTSPKEKVEEIKEIYTSDISDKNEEAKEEVSELMDDEIEFNEKEQESIESYEEDLETLNTDASLENSLNAHIQLEKMEVEVVDLKETAVDRIAREEAEAEAEAEAEKEAEAEAEAEALVAQQELEAVDQSYYAPETPISGESDSDYEAGVFNAVNAYRSSLGLYSYTYNDSMQSCVDSEAAAYASNGVPHNYVCQPIAAENAGLTVSGYYGPSDMVNLWKQDVPHNTPMVSTTNTSMAVSTYNVNGMLYIEACFW